MQAFASETAKQRHNQSRAIMSSAQSKCGSEKSQLAGNGGMIYDSYEKSRPIPPFPSIPYVWHQ